ncbi:MAG: M6 family metalloprotease domain-containing protein [Sedimentisphaerales bacterium]
MKSTFLHGYVIAIIAVVVLVTASVFAAPFAKKIPFTQPDGTEIELWGEGDEFYAVFETLDGYTVVFDPQTKAYHYAHLSADGNNLISVGVEVGKRGPAALGLAKHVRIKPEAVKKQAFERFQRWDQAMQVSTRWKAMKSERRQAELAAEGQGGSSGLQLQPSPPGSTTTGTKVGLCLLIDFSDDPATVPQAEIVNFCNGDNYTGYGNNGSVKKYYLDNSNNLLTYTNVVTIYIRAPQLKTYYNDTSKDCGEQARLLITDAITVMQALPDYNTVILPTFNALTVDGSNNVVAFNVFYAGGDGGVWNKGLWPHAWMLASPLELSAGGKKVYRYQISNIGSALEIGTFCHENGHMLCGFPDIYDYDQDSWGGAGFFCLMGYGSDGGTNGSNPVQICAYLKRAAGWANVTDLDSTSNLTATVTAAPTAGYNNYYRYRKPGVSTEYFLVENRQQTGHDASIPAAGVAVWHIDELGDKDNQSLAPNTTHANYEVTLVQADNLWHFEYYQDLYDAKDLYYAGNSASAYSNRLDDSSSPNAHWWDGTSSGVNFYDFSVSGTSMTFNYTQRIPIATKADLLAMAANTANYDKHFILTADIDMQGQVFTTAIIATSDFTGTFDGNGHKITNFTINGGSNDYLGLFGRIFSGGSVKNLGLENCSVSGCDYVGSLAGFNRGSISNCYSTGVVSGDYYYVGGLVGYNDDGGNISNCYSTGAVSSTYDPDGLQGRGVGGLVGVNTGIIISNCYSTGAVSGTYYVGGLVGENLGSISQCYSTGSVSGYAYVGGLVGDNDGIIGSISNCYSTGGVGGFGFFDEYGQWHPSGCIGGLVGINSSSISNCYSTGTVSGDDESEDVGGLVGYNYGSVVSSFWDTQTSGQTTSAGGTGRTTAQMKTLLTFTSAGWDFLTIWNIVEGQTYPFFRETNLTITATSGGTTQPVPGTYVYSLGSSVDISAIPNVNYSFDHWELDGSNVGSANPYSVLMDGNHTLHAVFVQNTYNLTITTTSGGTTNPVPGTHTYLAGSSVGVSAIPNVNYSFDHWELDGSNVGSANPYSVLMNGNHTLHAVFVFIQAKYSGGTGTADNPYQIAIAADLLLLAADTNDYNQCFILTADIDMEGQVFTTAIIAADTTSDSAFNGTAFTGMFDGNGHKITHFTINGGSNSFLGLFGYINPGGSVKNLGLENFTVSGSSGCQYVGGLVGWNAYGSISNCSSTGAVSGTSLLGGLVGYNNHGSINNCYSTGAVSGYNIVGGLVGSNNGGSSISNCYSTGAVSGSSSFKDVGGLVGGNGDSSISNCYSTGAVSGTSGVGGLVGTNWYGSISSSFWDTQTSGQTTSAGGTGKTTAEMKTLSTFTVAGWDFTNETANGTSDFWRMCVDGVDYPRLNWQSIEGDFACPKGVNVEDLNYFVQQWLLANCTSSNNYCGGADINGSGTVDFADFAMFAESWLEGI